MVATRREELDIINPTMSAIGQFLPDLFCEIGKKPNLKVVYCDIESNIEDELMRMYKNTDFPYCAIMQRSTTINQNYPYNFRAMQQIPYTVKQDNGMDGRFRLTPVTVTFEVRYCAGDYKSFSLALNRWLTRTDNLIFAINIKNLNMNIKCRLGNDVQLPNSEGGDNGSIRRGDFQIEADTYVGEIEYQEPLKQINTSLYDGSTDAPIITFARKRKQ